jgi:tRNA(fMet)-specific endonuclease VapC
MSGEFLLDTNIVVALFANDQSMCQRITADAKVVLSSTMLGELYCGAFKSQRVGENLRKINRLIENRTILGSDLGTALEYGALRNEQRRKGRPLPENDLWIAALARQHDLVLVSRDNHFADVERLKVVCW